MCKSAILIFSLALFCSCSRNAASQNKEATPAKDAAQATNQAKNAAAPPDGSAAAPVTKDDKPLVTRDGKPVAVRKGVHLYPVKIDEKYGYMDRSGKLVLKAEYTGGSRFSEGRAAVQLHLAGPSGGDWSVVREGDRWTLYAGAAETPAARAAVRNHSLTPSSPVAQRHAHPRLPRSPEA